MKPIIDILKELYYGSITEDEAYNINDEVTEDVGNGGSKYKEFFFTEDGVTYCNYKAIFGMEKYEYRAQCDGVPLSVIANWRYEGWPTQCCETGTPLDYKKDHWFAKKLENGDYGLIRLRDPYHLRRLLGFLPDSKELTVIPKKDTQQ